MEFFYNFFFVIQKGVKIITFYYFLLNWHFINLLNYFFLIIMLLPINYVINYYFINIIFCDLQFWKIRPKMSKNFDFWFFIPHFGSVILNFLKSDFRIQIISYPKKFLNNFYSIDSFILLILIINVKFGIFFFF